MNTIGTLYIYELKKIGNRKVVWIVGLIMLALSIFLSVGDLVTSSYYGETSVSAYQAMKINRENAEKLSGRTIDDTLLREMQEDCTDENKDQTENQVVTSDNQVAIEVGGSSEDDESGVLKKYFPVYSYVQKITDDNNLSLSINSEELYHILHSFSTLSDKIGTRTPKEVDFNGNDHDAEDPGQGCRTQPGGGRPAHRGPAGHGAGQRHHRSRRHHRV